jgi:HEAT repeat protein
MMFSKSFFNEKKSLSKFLLLLTFMTAAVLLSKFLHDEKARLSAVDKPAEKSVNSSPPPVDLSALAERAGNPLVLTPEQIEEDKRMDNEQVALASEWLRSIDPRQRIDGAEQLSAYPTAEAEILLVNALVTDIDPEVRSAAAQSLDAFERPTEKTLTALLIAVEDENEDVRMSALATLENIVAAEENGSARYKRILAGLKKKAASRRIPAETREAIRDFVRDQMTNS